MEHSFHLLVHYIQEILPALAIGFFISGLVHEVIPETIVLKYLGLPGMKPIFYSTLIGTLLPVCCWGSLPIAVSFYKKGAKLGPVLAFLVATPATSISALLVSYAVLGALFTVYTFFAVILMGIFMGLVGNSIKGVKPNLQAEVSCPHCKIDPEHEKLHVKKTFIQHASSAMKYAYIELPKEIGLELLLGLILAVLVASIMPIGNLIKMYLGGWFGYVFAVIFGLVMYICSTASVPLIDSFIKQGMNHGAAMTLLLLGPIVSYGTILVLRKEYGMKVLAIFIAFLVIATVLFGMGFQALAGTGI